ncbi:MAG: hypothetical protein WCX65_05310 [bacterium]
MTKRFAAVSTLFIALITFGLTIICAASPEESKTFDSRVEKIDGAVYSNYIYGFEFTQHEGWHIATNYFISKENEKRQNDGSEFEYTDDDSNPVKFDGTVVQVLKEPYGSIVEDNPELEIAIVDISSLPQKPTYDNMDVFLSLQLKQYSSNYYQQENKEVVINGSKMKKLVYSAEKKYGGKNEKGVIYMLMQDEDHMLVISGKALENTYKKYEESFVKMAESFNYPESLKSRREAFMMFGRGSKYFTGEKEWKDPDKTKALESLEKAVGIYPDINGAYAYLIKIYREKKMTDKLVEAAVKYLKIGETGSADYNMISTMLIKDKDQVGTVIDKLEESDKANKDYKVYRLMFLIDKHKAANIDAVSQLLKETKDNADMCSEAKKQIKYAEKWLEQMKELNKSPENEKTGCDQAAGTFSKGEVENTLRNALIVSKSLESLEQLAEILKYVELFRATGMSNDRSRALSEANMMAGAIDALTIITEGTPAADKMVKINKQFLDMKNEIASVTVCGKGEDGDNNCGQVKSVSDIERSLVLLMNSSRVNNDAVKILFPTNK